MKKGQFSKGLIILLLLYCVYFCERVLYIFTKTGSEPTMLISTVIGVIMVQLINLAMIKKVKIRSNDGTTIHKPSDNNNSDNSNDFGLEERL